MKLFTKNQLCKAKLLALFVFTFIVSSTYADHRYNNESSLRLLLPIIGEHTVIIDNIPYNGIYDRFKLDNLRAGNHRIKIVELLFSRRGYLIDRVVLYNGLVFIPYNSKIIAQVYNNGRFIIEKTLFFDNNCGSNNGNRGYNNRGNDNNQYDTDNGNKNSHNRFDDDYDNDDSYGYNYNNDRYNNSYDDRSYSKNRNVDKNQTFELTLEAIKKQSFDTERLKIAKNAVTNSSILCSEVAQITKLFSFESSRLEFAKYAYNYTIDKKNYVIVQDAFQFSSSTSELQDYITQMGNH